jgi:hypothetical protein
VCVCMCVCVCVCVCLCVCACVCVCVCVHLSFLPLGVLPEGVCTYVCVCVHLSFLPLGVLPEGVQAGFELATLLPRFGEALLELLLQRSHLRQGKRRKKKQSQK